MKMAIGKREEREKQQDSCEHIMGLCGKPLYHGGAAGVNVEESENQTLSLSFIWTERETSWVGARHGESYNI